MMDFRIKITPTALQDIRGAAKYYNKKQQALGKKFSLSIDAVISELKTTPASGSFMYEEVRYRVAKKFPYNILYEVMLNNIIIIYRIFNTSQNPF